MYANKLLDREIGLTHGSQDGREFPARGRNKPLLAEQFGQSRTLPIAESTFAVLAKNILNLQFALTFDFSIGIEQHVFAASDQLRSHGTFSRPHKTDENNIFPRRKTFAP